MADSTHSAASDPESSPLRRSPLHDRHVRAGAKMADFGGWSMPIEYAGGGVVAEHTAVRERVGLFDVSHLGKARVSGPGAAAFVNAALTNDLERIEPGKAQYTLCCDASGGVVDDLIAYLRNEGDVLLVPNAANTAEVVRRLHDLAPSGVQVSGMHDAFGVIAVQGPDCDRVLEAVGLPTGHDYMSFVDATWQGVPVVVCRTGYTGERGYELLPPWDHTPALWDALVDAVTAAGGRVAGLGARDTLRTEMGYPLHGHELSLDISPVQARAGWAVGWKKPEFWGKDALVAEKEAGASRLLWGVLALDRGIPRDGCTVRRDGLDGEEVGRTTSGTFSPTLKQGIALGLLERSVAEGDEVVVDVRGRGLRCRVVKPPFVDVQTR
ncbi:glycine cleavage system aminomethyltransferase GcvT [Angustibacter sp. McL0619]|uniref:glycine cleavage system aminomethyltransferase GcvT n=1 Tax=Angustibacter sp. McL0619 TaxID=3415676 RepID=UPI003CF1D9DC